MRRAPLVRQSTGSALLTSTRLHSVAAASQDGQRGVQRCRPSTFSRSASPSRALKSEGNTIKAITEILGLEAREGVWHRVSLLYRAEADRRGIARPGRRAM